MNSPLVMSSVQSARYLLGAEFARLVETHASAYQADLNALRLAAKANQRKKVREAQHRILSSFSAKLACIVRSLELTPGMTSESVCKMATQLNPWTGTDEPVTAWAEPKTSGKGWRPICAFGPRRTALQTLCADILSAKFEVDPDNYLSKGRGVEVASDQLVDLIEADGFVFFVLGDIENFFRSLQQERLGAITGLPEPVLRNCMLIGADIPLSVMSLPPGVTIEAFDGAVRSGLPQGSRASQIIAGMLLGPILRQIASDRRSVFYGDDSAIPARSEEEATAFEKVLRENLDAHPAGPFRVKSRVVNVHNGFNFLKYRFRRDWVTGRVRRRPSDHSYERYERRVSEIIQTEPLSLAVRSIAQYRYRWMRSFLRWQWNSISKFLLWYRTAEILWNANESTPKAPK